ncbi:hypothetical protein [Hyunsoonleella pacifica]|uniref:Uncharacterized protein n=1 Tax=Hyunsoonleella pacifica TaxID=1080224 RepID=A0A4Q9FRB9_9FLAO|nr:hypothetical protein [Hyunsoonleella pacifica]TBN18554.1 hypothetical protein EYD46_00355 [Hyunsoonleella pacifica]GGD02779.1 hypothetical protein GCM10011368_00720 [Hyunsoonleella pacifica]
MASLICPNCGEDSFTWSLDEEISELTIWNCYKCEYQAYENEKDERNCQNCERRTETKLKDNRKEYWWCSDCNSKSEIKTA